MKSVAFIHTTMNTPAPLKKAFLARFPEVTLYSYMDDSILSEIGANNDHYTPGIVRRLIQYANNAQQLGASVVVCMCTTITGAVAQAKAAVDIPFITIDGPMLEAAVKAGKRVALLVTAKTTLQASSESARRAAVEAGREEVQVDTILVPGAFEALNLEGDKAKHDQLIAEAARKAAEDHDVIALAQVSMVDAAALLSDLKVPVFTSLESGINQIEKYLK